MYKLIILTLLSLIVFGCEKTIKERPKPFLSENMLREIAVNAINGERTYNNSLSGLIDYSLPLNSNFNALKIERFISPINKTFFALLINLSLIHISEPTRQADKDKLKKLIGKKKTDILIEHFFENNLTEA